MLTITKAISYSAQMMDVNGVSLKDDVHGDMISVYIEKIKTFIGPRGNEMLSNDGGLYYIQSLSSNEDKMHHEQSEYKKTLGQLKKINDAIISFNKRTSDIKEHVTHKISFNDGIEAMQKKATEIIIEELNGIRNPQDLLKALEHLYVILNEELTIMAGDISTEFQLARDDIVKKHIDDFIDLFCNDLPRNDILLQTIQEKIPPECRLSVYISNDSARSAPPPINNNNNFLNEIASLIAKIKCHSGVEEIIKHMVSKKITAIDIAAEKHKNNQAELINCICFFSGSPVLQEDIVRKLLSEWEGLSIKNKTAFVSGILIRQLVENGIIMADNISVLLQGNKHHGGLVNILSCGEFIWIEKDNNVITTCDLEWCSNLKIKHKPLNGLLKFIFKGNETFYDFVVNWEDNNTLSLSNVGKYMKLKKFHIELWNDVFKWCCAKGYMDKINILCTIGKGAGFLDSLLTSYDSYGKTAIIYSIENQQQDITKTLFEYADMKTLKKIVLHRRHSYMPLTTACRCGDYPTVKLFLDNKLNCSTTNDMLLKQTESQGLTALHAAIISISRNDDCVKFILAFGDETKILEKMLTIREYNDERTPLLLACSSSNYDAAKRIVEKAKTMGDFFRTMCSMKDKHGMVAADYIHGNDEEKLKSDLRV